MHFGKNLRILYYIKQNIERKNIITYFEYKENKLHFVRQNSSPSFKLFLIEVDFFLSLLI